MKRLISAGVLFVILILICIVTQCYTHTAAENTIKILKSAEKNAAMQTAQNAEKINGQWERYEKVLMSYSDHTDIEDISKPIGILAEHIECGEYEKFKVECKNAINALEHLKKNEKPLIENIL